MKLEGYMTVLIALWIFTILFCYKEFRYAKTLQNQSDSKLIYWIQPILLIGVLIRTIYLYYPFGVFCDEAINGYDSWCIANYGVDQHLISNSVYLKSWGSGQTALYAYIAAPFIKLFGLSTSVHRLPMALISCISILFFYWTLRKTQKNKLLTFIITAFLVINPWHIMKSRWALDCNICPDLVLIGLCLIMLGYYSTIVKRRTIYYLAANIFFALSAYSYAVSWFMLPLFCIGIFIYLLRKKKISYMQLGMCFISIAIIALPLVLFAINHFTNGGQYSFGPFTIPELIEDRHLKTTLIGREDILTEIYIYFKRAGMLLGWGADGLIWNSMSMWGQYYNPLGILFIIYYFYSLIKERKTSVIDALFLIWLISMLPTLILVGANANHWNLLWFPLIYFCARGIYLFINKYKKAKYVVAALFICSFILFSYEYFDYYKYKNKDVYYNFAGFTQGMEEPVDYLKDRDFDKVYYMNTKYSISGNNCYIVLFYNPISPYTFDKSKEVKDNTVIGYLNNYFYKPVVIEPESGTAYLIPNEWMQDIDTDGFIIKEFEQFTLMWND